MQIDFTGKNQYIEGYADQHHTVGNLRVLYDQVRGCQDFNAAVMISFYTRKAHPTEKRIEWCDDNENWIKAEQQDMYLTTEQAEKLIKDIQHCLDRNAKEGDDYES